MFADVSCLYSLGFIILPEERRRRVTANHRAPEFIYSLNLFDTVCVYDI